MHNTDLTKLHALELMILTEIQRICQENDINYFALAGTALGAVRHGGFIPWDDDVDIGMLRKDYDRFLVACGKSLDSKFYLQTWDNDRNFPFSFAKIRLEGTHFVEAFSNNQEHNGIFIDVFPMDNCPSSPILFNIQNIRYYICKRLLWVKKGYGEKIRKENIKQRLKYDAFQVLSKFFDYDSVKKYFKQIQTRYNTEMSEFVSTDGSYTYRKESMLFRWTTAVDYLEFENMHIPVFKDYDSYLKKLYGDYMILPPEDKRGVHERVNVDFGIYE